MAANFNGADHIEKFPHKYDPFTDGQTALRKKVVFRPNKHQLDAIRNRKKTISVNADSKVNGQGPVHHEKQFSTKNATYVELKTHAESGVVSKANHEKQFASKNSIYVETNTQAAIDTTTKPNHEQVVLDKKSQVAPVDAGINLGHWEDVNMGVSGVMPQNKVTQAVNTVTTAAQYDEYEPLFISKTDLAKAQYRKSNSIREDFNTRAVVPESVVEPQAISKSSRVKGRQHDVVAAETQATFEGYEIDGDHAGLVDQKPRRQKADSQYSIDNYQGFEQGIEPHVDKPTAPRRRQKSNLAIEVNQQDGINVEAERPSVSKGQSRRQQDSIAVETHEVFSEYDSRNPEMPKPTKKPSRQVQFALETDDNFGVDVNQPQAKPTSSKIRRQKAAQDIDQTAEYALEGFVEEDKTIHRSKGSRQAQYLPVETDGNYEVDIEPLSQVVHSGKSKRHQAEVTDQFTEYKFEHPERVESTVNGKPRRQQVEVAVETHDEAALAFERGTFEMNRQLRRHQAEIAVETQDDTLVAFERPSIGKTKVRRHIKEVGLETHDEYHDNPVSALQDKINLRHRTSRQTSQHQLDQVAEFAEVVVEKPSKFNSKSRRQQARVDSQSAHNEESIVTEHSTTILKAAKNRRQAQISHDADAEYNAVNRDYDKTTKGKHNRQKTTIDEEGVPVYQIAETEREKVNRKVISRQKANLDQEAGIEMAYDGESHSDVQNIHRRRHVSSQNLDTVATDPNQYVEAYDEAPLKSKASRQVQLMSQRSTVDYADEIISGDRHQPKPKRRVQFNLDSQEAGMDVESLSRNQQPHVANRRKVQADQAVEYQAEAKFEVEPGKHHPSNNSKRQQQAVAAAHDSTIEGIDIKVISENTEKSRRRQQAIMTNQDSTIDGIEVQTTRGEVDRLRGRHQNLPQSSTATLNVDYQPAEVDTAENGQHRRQATANQLSAVQKTNLDVEIDTRDVTRIPNTRPVKQQAQSGVLIAIRNPELDVKTRVQQALDRSRRQTAIVDSEEATPTVNHSEMAVKTEEVVGSSRRQYSAKQDNETANPVLSGTRTQATDVSKNSNRRQEQAQPENQTAIIQIDVEMATRLVVDKQGVDGKVDAADVNSHSGMLNPIDEDAGIDPVTLDAANTKKHLAREGSIETTPDTILYEDGADRTGLETNTRSRVLIIDPSILARAYGPLRLRRKVK
jgi:hypothetical protein